VNRALTWMLLILLSCSFAIHVAGCSILGASIGAIADARRPRTKLVPTGRVVKFYPGDKLVLFLKDSTRVEGIYAGPDRLSDSNYVGRYQRWRAASPENGEFPLIGERIRVGESGITSADDGKFVGFVHRGLEIDRRGSKRVRLFEDHHWLLRSDGHRIDLARVSKQALAGELPVITALRVRSAESTRTVPLNDVGLVYGPTHPQGARMGFVIGLTVDAAVAVAIMAFASSYQGPFAGASGCSYTPSTY
jgi:hypothetical protein